MISDTMAFDSRSSFEVPSFEERGKEVQIGLRRKHGPEISKLRPIELSRFCLMVPVNDPKPRRTG